MNVYIALLRGINVGGKNIIKMAELKKVFESIGLYEVQTYIQSGNVLFKSNEDEEHLRRKIETGIESFFGFSCVVVLRTVTELKQIIINLPFSEEEVSDAESSSQSECLYVALLNHAPSTEKIGCLEEYRSLNDDYRIIGREVFILLRHSIRDSKLANNLHKLDMSMTIRNWKTINKVYDLANATGL